MKQSGRMIGFLLAAGLWAGMCQGASELSDADREAWLGAINTFGSHFEANAGQLPPHARYAFRGQGYRFDLLDNGIALATDLHAPVHPMVIEFSGCRSGVTASGRQPLAFRVQHPTAPEHASRKMVSAPAFAAVRMDGMYDGIDVDYQVHKGNLQYDFIVAAGANPDVIALRFEGASDVRFDGNGNLAVELENGLVLQHKPFLYQVVEGARLPVDGEYVRLPSNEIGIRVGPYDASLPLIIDPVLTVILEEKE